MPALGLPLEVAVAGSVTVAARANVRQGLPSRSAPILRKQEAGNAVAVTAVAVGEAVAGNALWYRLDSRSYLWSGACGAFGPSGTAGASRAGTTAVDDATRTSGPAEPPLFAAGAPAALVANVVDLYHGDGVTNFALARASGVLGIIHKATTGGTGRDDAYHRRRPLARDAGLLWGAYHWGTAAPPAKQVDNFLLWADPDENTLVALDFERDVGNQMTLQVAREFLTLVEEKLGRKAVIYSGPTIKEALGDRRDPFFGAHRLWLAQYGPRPQVQASWSGYWLWQFTEGKANDPRRRNVPGIPGNANGALDGDYFPGTAEELAAQWAT